MLNIFRLLYCQSLENEAGDDGGFDLQKGGGGDNFCRKSLFCQSTRAKILPPIRGWQFNSAKDINFEISELGKRGRPGLLQFVLDAVRNKGDLIAACVCSPRGLLAGSLGEIK